MTTLSSGEVLARSFANKSYRSDAWAKRTKEFIKNHPFCNSCKRSRADVKLNTHHAIYRKGVSIEDHPDEDLVVLCEDCHRLIHEVIESLKKMAAFSNASNIARITVALGDQLKLEGELRVLERLVR